MGRLESVHSINKRAHIDKGRGITPTHQTSASQEHEDAPIGKIPPTDKLRSGLHILTGLPFLQEGPFPERGTPVMFFTQDAVAETIEDARKVRDQHIPESMRLSDPAKRIIGIMKRANDDRPLFVFVVNGQDGFQRLWTTMQPLLQASPEGQALLTRIETLDRLNMNLNEIIAYIQKLDTERIERQGGNSNMPKILPMWVDSKDGNSYFVNVSSEYSSYIVEYLDEQAKGIGGRQKNSVRILPVMPETGRDFLATLTGVNVPGAPWFTRSPEFSHMLVLSAKLAENPRFQQALVSPDILGLLGDALCNTDIFKTAVQEAYGGRYPSSENSSLAIISVHPDILQHPDDIPQRLAAAFDTIIAISAPYIMARAQIVTENTLNVILPYAAVMNTNVLDAIMDNRAFQGLQKIMTTNQSFTLLPESVGELTGISSWELNADAKRNTFQFELPISNTEYTKKAVQIIKDIAKTRLNKMSETVKSDLESLLTEESVRLEDNKIILPAFVIETFGLTIQTSDKLTLLKKTLAKAHGN